MPKQEMTVVDKTVEQASKEAMMEGGGIVAAVFAIVHGFMWLRRRYSRDSLELRRDSEEGGLLGTIIHERNEAMADAKEAWARRAADAELIGKLSAQVEALEKLNHKTNNEVHLLRLLNDRLQNDMAEMRIEVGRMKDQIEKCATCPLRKVRNEMQAN